MMNCTFTDFVISSLSELREGRSYVDYATHGLLSELGELHDLYSKQMRVNYDLDHKDVLNELGDVYYWFTALNHAVKQVEEPSAELRGVKELDRAIVLYRVMTEDVSEEGEILLKAVTAVVQKLSKRKDSSGSFVKRHTES